MGVEEIAYVIQHILCKTHTEEQALAIVERLDLDGDGKISVQELMGFVEEYSEADGQEVLNVRTIEIIRCSPLVHVMSKNLTPLFPNSLNSKY